MRFPPSCGPIFIYPRLPSIAHLSRRLNKSLSFFTEFVPRSLLFLQRLIQQLDNLFFPEGLSHLDDGGVAGNLIMFNARSGADDQDVAKRGLLALFDSFFALFNEAFHAFAILPTLLAVVFPK